jgi:nitrogen fixation NifU-like protein
MFDDLTDLYQQVIMDHSREPRNFRAMERPDRQSRGTNPLCGDQYTLYFHLDGDVIKEVTFEGSGCAISKASASILTEVLQGRTIAEARKMFDQVHEMVTHGHVPEGDLGKLAVFAGVHKFPARVKCAILPWHAAIAALEGSSETVSTE